MTILNVKTYHIVCDGGCGTYIVVTSSKWPEYPKGWTMVSKDKKYETSAWFCAECTAKTKQWGVGNLE